MVVTRPFRSGVILFLLTLFVAGCAQSRLSHEPGLVTAWDRSQPLAGTAAPVISVELYTRHLMFGEPAESPVSKWWTKQKLREQVRDVQAEFPFLAHARWKDAEERTGVPYRLLIEATHAIDGNKTLHWFSSTSRYLIPSRETGMIELDAQVIRTDNETVLKEYAAVGTYRITRHVVFLAFPWWWGYRVPSRTMEDAFRDLFLQMQRDAAMLFGPGASGA